MFRIMKTGEYLDDNDPEPIIFYRAACHCSDNRHDIDMSLSLDAEFELMYLTFWKDLDFAAYYQTDNWFMEMWIRIKQSLKLLFTGRIKVESEFIFEGDKHINEFIEALEHGKAELKNVMVRRKMKEMKNGKN